MKAFAVALNRRRFVCLLWLFGIAFGSGLASAESPATAPSHDAAPGNVEPQYRMSVAQLKAELSRDWLAGRKKYQGVTIELSGEVTWIDSSPVGTRVTIAGPRQPDVGPSDFISGIDCKPIAGEIWATVGRNQPVNAVGVISFTSMSPVLTNAQFTLVGPSVLISLSADDLAAQAASDPEGTRKKYMAGSKGKTLIVTGRLVKKDVLGKCAALLFLGKPDNPVWCDCMVDNPDSRKTLDAIPLGQTVKLAGLYTPSEGGKIASLVRCLLITQ